MPQKPHSLPRSWGSRFDPLPSSPPTSPNDRQQASGRSNTSVVAPDVKSEPALNRKDDRQVHDASIFVGSLPPNVEQQDLATLLTQHLSEHDEVQGVKVIRDSRGGVCAFVQCENPTAAQYLLKVLQSTPTKPFLGRTLRYEPARAFRTLLISYRAPVQTMRTTDENVGDLAPKQVLLDLPTSMRLRKSENARYVSLSYGSEALDPFSSYEPDEDTNDDSVDLLLSPLAFNEETIKRLVLFFGPLEVFEPYGGANLSDSSNNSHQEGRVLVGDSGSLPAPHDAERGASMHGGCWTVKWRHREDCINALLNLRRVPHLTVTWSHQPSAFHAHHRLGNQIGAYPFHVQPRPMAVPQKPTLSSSFSPTVAAVAARIPLHPATHHQTSHNTITDQKNIPNVNTTRPTRADNSEFLSTDHKKPWSDTDFPPLGNMHDGGRIESTSWGDSTFLHPEEHHPDQLSPALTTSTSICRSTSGASTCEDGQDVDVMGTPELGMSPITPDTSNSVLETPSASMADLTLRSYPSKEDFLSSSHVTVPREVDPTTIFVGGLETTGLHRWDGDKLRRYFGRFGGIEDVTVVHPAGQRSAFGFVKFDNVESSARAVREEHNSMHNGRQMRVQLRDCNPPRAVWKTTRVRGRGGALFSAAPRSFPLPAAYQPITVKTETTDGAIGSVEASSAVKPESSDVIEFPTIANTVPDKLSASNGLNPQSKESSIGPSPVALSSPQLPQSDKYREWYVNTGAAVNAATPGNIGQSILPMPFNGYYAHHPWMHPYHYPYPVPLVQGYSAPAHPQNTSSPGGAEEHASGATPSPQVAPAQPSPGVWNPTGPFYAPLMPYGAYAPTLGGRERPPTGQQQQPNQAPVTPAGFFHHEQGGLIAVYHPEVMSHYMSSSSGGPPSAQPWMPLPAAPYGMPLGHAAGRAITPHALPSPGATPVAGGWVPTSQPTTPVGPPTVPHFTPRPMYAEHPSPHLEIMQGRRFAPNGNNRRGHHNTPSQPGQTNQAQVRGGFQGRSPNRQLLRGGAQTTFISPAEHAHAQAHQTQSPVSNNPGQARAWVRA